MVKTSKINWSIDNITAEDNSGEIVTKPNGNQTIREILFRNTQGMTYDNYKTPFYEDQATWSSQSLNEIQSMDITDKMTFLDNLKTKTEDLKSKIQAYKNEQDALAQAKAQEVADAIANNTPKDVK